MHGGRELVCQALETLDKDKVAGTINEIAGRARREIGEWTGDGDVQFEALAQEVRGTAQKARGNGKDAVRAAAEQAREERPLHESEESRGGAPRD